MIKTLPDYEKFLLTRELEISKSTKDLLLREFESLKFAYYFSVMLNIYFIFVVLLLPPFQSTMILMGVLCISIVYVYREIRKFLTENDANCELCVPTEVVCKDDFPIDREMSPLLAENDSTTVESDSVVCFDSQPAGLGELAPLVTEEGLAFLQRLDIHKRLEDEEVSKMIRRFQRSTRNIKLKQLRNFIIEISHPRAYLASHVTPFSLLRCIILPIEDAFSMTPSGKCVSDQEVAFKEFMEEHSSFPFVMNCPLIGPAGKETDVIIAHREGQHLSLCVVELKTSNTAKMRKKAQEQLAIRVAFLCVMAYIYSPQLTITVKGVSLCGNAIEFAATPTGEFYQGVYQLLSSFRVLTMDQPFGDEVTDISHD